MADPELNLKVTADISALTAAMKTAQASVSTSAERMERSLSQRFDQSFSNINRGFGRVSRGAQVGMAAAAAAAGDLDATIANLPGNLGAVAMAGKTLYDTLHESFTGAKAAAEELNKQLEIGSRVVDFRQQAEASQLDLAILKEKDPFEKRRMETQKQLNALRREFNRMNTEGATPQAIEALKAKEALVREQEAIDLLKIREKVEADGMAKTDKRLAIEDDLRESDRQATRERLSIQRRQQQLAREIAAAEEPHMARRIELEQRLAEIEQERLDRNSAYSDDNYQERVFADEIAASERNAAIRIAAAEIETDLAEKRQELLEEEEAARMRMQPIQQVESSFGGALRVANTAAQRGQTIQSERQTELQAEIKSLVRELLNVQRQQGIQ